MSVSLKRPLVRVEIRAADPVTEIFLIDANLQLVGQGVGVLVTDKPAGLYQVKLRAGTHTMEELIKLRDEPFEKTYPPLEFSSPVPLPNTYKSHEFHCDNARDHSKIEHVKKGSGSSIYVFARDWTGKRPAAGEETSAGTYENPARGLTLVDASGSELVDFAKQSATQLDWEPWAACNITVDPGLYILRLHAPDGSVWERTLVASPVWQTQCFLLQRDYKDKKGPDLSGATVLLRELGVGFTPDSGEHRLVELARLGLVDQRPILSDEVEALLTQKFENPLLGIFGAHLLLMLEQKRGRPYEPGLLQHVVEKLRYLLKEPHPDVESLAWKAGLGDENYRFGIPPMLRRGWVLMTQASADRPEVVQEGSLVTRMYDRMLAEGPWLIWSGEQAADDESLVVETLALYLQSQLPDQEPHGALDPPPFAADVLTQSDVGFGAATPEPKNDARDLTEQLSIPRSVVEQYLPRAVERAKDLESRNKRRR